MTEYNREELEKAIQDQDAHLVHQQLLDYMNNRFSEEMDNLEESIMAENDTEQKVVDEISVAARSLGANADIEYEDGTLLVTFSKKEEADNFLDWVDEHSEYIEDFEIEVYNKDGSDPEEEELDYDTLKGDDKWSIEVYVHLEPIIVSFSDDVYELDEMKRVQKVNSMGKKRVKIQCQKGFKLDSGRGVCVKMAGNELLSKRKAIKKAVRTKRQGGAAYKLRVTRKMKKAKSFRKGYGLK